MFTESAGFTALCQESEYLALFLLSEHREIGRQAVTRYRVTRDTRR